MKNKMIFWICLTFIFLASLGFSFAWFSTQIEGNDTAKMVTTSSSILKLVFDDSGEDITLSNMHPGDFIEKTITVENTGTEPSGYKLEWLELQNEFYSMEIRIEGTCTSYKDGVVTGTCESFEKGVGSTIIHRVDSIGVGYTHEYNIKIEFKEKSKNQNYNQGKNFSGKIGISDFVRPKGTPVYVNGVKPVNNCTFDGELVQGAEYVNGQYTYRYMQKVAASSGGSYDWYDDGSTDGWGLH